MSKYNNKKCTYNGHTFDSQVERDFYIHLLNLQEKGLIEVIETQKKYTLLEGYEKNGKKIRPITYVADFFIRYTNGKTRVIDIKGFQTTDSKLKKKMFDHKFTEELELITYSRLDGGWISLEDLKKARKQRKLEKDRINKVDKI